MTAKKAVQTPRFFRFLHYYIGFFNFQHNSSGFIFCYTFKPKRTFSIFRLYFVKQCGRTWKSVQKRFFVRGKACSSALFYAIAHSIVNRRRKYFFAKNTKKQVAQKPQRKIHFLSLLRQNREFCKQLFAFIGKIMLKHIFHYVFVVRTNDFIRNIF